MSDDVPLPPLHDAILGPDEVLALVADVTSLADVLGTSIKGGSNARATGTHETPTEGATRLVSGEIAGLQLRYRHDGKEWWDTLMTLGDGRFRLVRIEQRWTQNA